MIDLGATILIGYFLVVALVGWSDLRNQRREREHRGFDLLPPQ